MSSRRPPSPEPDEEINATQFEPGGDSDRELWAATTILDERKRKKGVRTVGEYLVDWEGTDPETGKRWEPSWEPKKDCTNVLIQEWKSKKKADPEIEGRYTREQEALKKADRKTSRRKSSSRAKTPKHKLRGDTATGSRSVSIEPGKAEKRKRSATVDEDEAGGLKQAAPGRRRSLRSGALDSEDDESPQRLPATKRQRSAAPTSVTPGPSKSQNQAGTSRRPARNDRIKSASVVVDSEDENEVPVTPSNGDPDSLEHRLQLQSQSTRAADKGKGREIAEPTASVQNPSKANPRVYGKARVRRKSTSEPASNVLKEVFVDLSDEIEEALSDPEVYSIESSRPVSPELQDLAEPASVDLEENIFESRNARAPGEKHVAFESTQDSEESVVPGTLSTTRASQESQISGAESRAGSEGFNGNVEGPLESGSEISDDRPEPDRQHPSLETLHNPAQVPSPESESTRRAIEAAMQNRNTSAQIEENRDIDATISRSNNGPEVDSRDAIVPASQIDLFQAAVELMAEYGFEGDDSMSQASRSEREAEASQPEQPQPLEMSDPDHLPEVGQAGATGSTDSQDQSHPNSRPTTPVRRAIVMPIQPNPLPLRALGLSTGSIVQHLSYTQGTIEQFSSPVRGSLPGQDAQPGNGTASPAPTQGDDFELVSPSRLGADQAAAVKQHLEQMMADSVAQPVVPQYNADPGSDRDESQSKIDKEVPGGPASPSTRPQQAIENFTSPVATKFVNEGSTESAGEMVAETANAGMLSLQARVQELEALVSQQDGKLSVNKEELEAAQVAAESREERIEFFRGLFNEASQKAGDFARENTALESRNATLKEQLDVGLKQQKLHYEAVNRRAEAERIKLEHQLAFLLEQNRATGDSVRHRAIQYPKLQKKHQNLVEAHMKLQKELRVSKKTNRQLQHDLDMLGPSDDSEEPYDSDQDVEAYPGPEDLRNRGYPVQPRKQSGASEIAQPHLMEGSMALVMPEPSNEVGSPNYPDFVHAEGPNVEESGEADANIGTLDLPQEHIPDASSSLTPEDKHKSGLLSFLKSSFAAAKLPLELRIDVIQSGHRRLTETTHVFPYTDVRHRILESRILVTVTGQATGNMTQDEQAPLLLSALEARVYTLPNKATTMVYISKVDSSGYSALPARYKPPAITSCLTRSFLRYYLSQQTRPTPRVFCHLFARAQKQYLFANSSDGGEKKVLSGLGLCKWWRNVFERVATELQQETTAGTQDVESPDRIQLQCWLPGAEPAEAKNMMGSTGDSSASHLTWSYNPPFGDTQATPMYNPEDTVRQLAYLIPRFEDDPKARYLDELVISRAGKASATLRREGANKEAEPQASTERTSKALQQKKKDDQAKLRQEAALSLQNIKPGDFWATLAGRQDCSPGDQTGFIGLALVPAVATDMPADYATVLEHHLTSSPGLNPKILDRLVTAMLNHDFGTRKYALTATSRFLSEIERIVSAEIGATEWEQNCTANIPCQGDPVLAVVSSSSNTPSSTPVNVLQPVRKKKKAPPSISAPATQSPSATPESGPPKEMHQCHWRLQEGAQERCKALFETLQDLESHAVSHMLT